MLLEPHLDKRGLSEQHLIALRTKECLTQEQWVPLFETIKLEVSTSGTSSQNPLDIDSEDSEDEGVG